MPEGMTRLALAIGNQIEPMSLSTGDNGGVKHATNLSLVSPNPKQPSPPRKARARSRSPRRVPRGRRSSSRSASR